LNEFAIGLALLGYGVPGFLFGPALGKMADRYGRRYLIPVGLVIAGISSIILAIHTPVFVAAIMVTVLSLGYDMTQPLLAGIVTDLSPNKGLAIGLMAFVLFLGFGTGSWVFSATMQRGLSFAFISFGILGLVLAFFGFPLYKKEEARA
jgi:MFS family permease